MTEHDDLVDDERPRKRPIDYRDPRLVTALLGLIAEADEDLDPKAIERDFASDLWKPVTISRTLGDLANMGAIRKVKPFRSGPRTPSKLRVTELGRAWLEQRVERFVGDPPDPGDKPSTE